ncbi:MULTISPECIES: BPTD_3080 family restriction endonuclease [unclassified Microbacterium]|uniref:BPTD_3080 family restriction endonuclease n=1 Tax=unclassified Microbacterium TaxID=2609290 RepID=UPI0030105F34
MTTQGSLENPIINSPYEEPRKHWVVGENGPTGEIADFRRPSEFFVPVPKVRKRSAKAAPVQPQFEQLELELNATDEKVERNDFVDQLRAEVRHWRQFGYQRVTPISRKLLEHWADEKRENRILFAQRESAETAIFLAEVVGRRDYVPSRGGQATAWLDTIRSANAEHNANLPRIALKMATGSGKTIVMAMLIAWQTLNKIASPHDARFAKKFLVVTPGITIRDRLKVLQPGDEENYYDLRGLVPSDLRSQLGQAEIQIVNYHQFMPRDAKEIKGVNANTRKLLLAGKAATEDPFRETPQAVVSRVLRGFSKGKGDIVVLNDEAHHCYQPRDLDAKLDADSKEANEDARVWFRGLVDIRKHAGIKQIYDLSATPFYLTGSGWAEGLIFPWTVSDFSLMDAIESGIVKIPRLPVDDDAASKQVTYLHLYDQIKDDPHWPRSAKSAPANPAEWVMPAALEGALLSLYKSYVAAFAEWEATLREHGEPPPVMIVVSPNTLVSRLIFDWIAGYDIEQDGATVHANGKLPLFSNVVNGEPLARPRTIVVDSKQLESDAPLKADFKDAAAEEIEAFKKQYRLDNPGADTDKLTDKDLLREVMNTVGKKGKLGEQVRCVVSVAMLTEGWDANTVTHILGIRAFGSQLLCEQVVGRGLRRRSYAPDEETDLFAPEYSNVYGIPFAFIPSDKAVPPPKPPQLATRVRAVEDRDHLRIDFPILSGYRVEIPDAKLIFDPRNADILRIDGDTVPSWVETAGIVGQKERIEGIAQVREQALSFQIAERILRTYFMSQGDRRPWLFPQLVTITKEWLRDCVYVDPGYSLGYLALAEPQQLAAATIYNAITRLESEEARRPRLRPILRAFEPTGTTASVHFDTRKKVIETEFSHVSHVTLDGKDGNEWEKRVARVCEELAAKGTILSYVKNDQLGFAIPYVHLARTHEYWPDFLLRLPTGDNGIERTLIVEVSGSHKSPGPTKEKARTARDSWCVAVNNHGGFGRWGYIEMHKYEVDNADTVLPRAIHDLIAGTPIIGDPDLLDDNVLAERQPAHQEEQHGA